MFVVAENSYIVVKLHGRDFLLHVKKKNKRLSCFLLVYLAKARNGCHGGPCVCMQVRLNL